ncbi:biotin/lipoyl-binding protein [Pseudoflavitalea sp. G-6-1-2]|uniref:efflux RND transporter periplasmic adaptor subunit n=1 Tax=Pseudoflavitalea sp. G-6-1-2 TaxID=2728841 RepID=UPI00146CE2B3|nr:efflux RND transporter periplasmic adaptor subunit [Pseudoflavitalea sp. G-6-1-2]NML21354.1 biotin/lipoyl-binding protein [Pseudoflavitalea sp. G-6-1-2]
MKNSYIVKSIILASATAFLLAACKENAAQDAKGGHKEALIDSSVRSLTQPANQQVVAGIPVITAAQGARIFSAEVNGVISYDTRNQTSIASRVAGRIERLHIKYNYQPVKRGQLIMELYSPDLAAAQRELLFVAANDVSMLDRAKEKLLLAGMQPAQISELLRTGKILYRIPVYSNSDGYILEKTAAAIAPTPGITSAAPASGGDGMAGMGGAGATPASASAAAPVASPVMLREGQYVAAGQSLFTIYQSTNLVAEFAFSPALASKMKTGQNLLFYPNENSQQMQSGKIGLIEPVFRNGENFTLARVYLGNADFQPGQLLTANVPVVYCNSWWLPKQAVWMQGAQAIIFIKEQSVFRPVQIRTGIIGNDAVQVLSDLTGKEIASNAFYMVDSESFIKVNDSIQ